MQTEQLLREVSKGLLWWYDFIPGKTVLYIGKKTDAIAELLAEVGLIVTCAELTETSVMRVDEPYHYIISIQNLEEEAHPEHLLTAWRGLLSEDGRLLLGVNNRLGSRYFCGDRDPYTDRSFDGVEGYHRAYAKSEDVFHGRCYSRAEWKRMLGACGLPSLFYSVLSDLNHPSHIYAEDYLPNENLSNRVTRRVYNYPDAVFLEEEKLWDAALDNGMFHTLANAYLIECSPSGQFCGVNHVTCSLERGKENARLTILRKNGMVEKRAIYPEGMNSLKEMAAHEHELFSCGIPVVNGQIEDRSYITPHIDAPVGQVHLKALLLSDTEKFLQAFDQFVKLILHSSEHVKEDCGDGEGILLRKGYPDMVPLNSFYLNGEFVLFDQEFSRENYPANAVILRAIRSFYYGNPEFEKILSADVLLKRYGLNQQLDRWQRMEWEFLDSLLNTKYLWKYYQTHGRDPAVVHSNRLKINYSAEAYNRLFVDIFNNADTRKLILFGSGNFAKKFIALYGQDYPVYAIVDNRESTWGQLLEGIEIHSPDILRKLQPGEYKVLICIKNYLSVIKQLDELGVGDYSIYDAGKDYPRKRKPTQVPQAAESISAEKKKFHVGYVPGVFDLFHIGHLNLFKRAKEQCDYLIVGVCTDEWVMKYKKKTTMIPFAERMELVRSCRYVDEAVAIPPEYSGIQDAYRLHHFDCQFTGSDHADDPHWLAERDFLRKHGAELVFFPYTESTSSTKLRELINEKLI